MIRTDKNPRISSKRGKGKLLETEKKRSLYFVFCFFFLRQMHLHQQPGTTQPLNGG